MRVYRPGTCPDTLTRIIFYRRRSPIGLTAGHEDLWATAHTAAHPIEMMYVSLCLIFGGVYERFSSLRIALLEANCSWLPFWLWRMDEHYEHRENDLRSNLPLTPTEYFRRHRCLAKRGCKVMLNGLGDPQAIEAQRDAMEKDFQVEVLYHPADLLHPEQIVSMIERAESAFGAVDILMNNAGLQDDSADIEAMPLEKWDSIIGVNLSAAFHTIRAALPKMKERGWRRIINTASSHGLVASPQRSPYIASKHGLVGLTKVVALETAQLPITCNAICPGFVLTPAVREELEVEAAAEGIPFAQAAANLMSPKQPSRQFATPDDVAQLVVFLCSDAAAQIHRDDPLN